MENRWFKAVETAEDVKRWKPLKVQAVETADGTSGGYRSEAVGTAGKRWKSLSGNRCIYNFVLEPLNATDGDGGRGV